jgi:uncharacterized repeat protein (TIGR04076 family)
MNKVKITVLETTFNDNLAKEYGVDGLGRCQFHQEGQVFYADYAKPEGFAMRRGRQSTSLLSPLDRQAGHCY